MTAESSFCSSHYAN